MRALAATVVGLFIAWGGLVIPGMHFLSTYGWFAGFFGAGLAYLAITRLFPVVPVTDVIVGDVDTNLEGELA